MITSTLAIVKCGVLEQHRLHKLLSMTANMGFCASWYTAQLSEDQIRQLYAEHQGRPYWDDLVRSVGRGRVAVGRISADLREDLHVSTVWRTFMGPSNCRLGQPGQLRWVFGDHGGPMAENGVHGSDGPASAERELELFFKEETESWE